MGNRVTFDYSKTEKFISASEVTSMEKIVALAKETLMSKTGAGNDFLGWVDLPVDYDKEEFARIKKAAEKIQSDSEVLIVIGIGGSYLGARAALEFCIIVLKIKSQERSAKRRKSILQGTASAAHIFSI